MVLHESLRLYEGIGNVFEKEQPEDDMLVLGGVNRAPQLVCRLPERFGFDSDRSTVRILSQGIYSNSGWPTGSGGGMGRRESTETAAGADKWGCRNSLRHRAI